MKLIIFVILVGLILSGNGMGQVTNAQSPGKWTGSGVWDLWKVRTDSVLADTFWVMGTDTVYSEMMLTWPFGSLAAEVGDSSSTDSCGYKVNLQQWIYYRSAETYRTSDLGKLVYCRTLSWNGEAQSLASLSTITEAGSWLAHLTDEAIFVVPFHRFQIIGTASNKAGGAGSWIKLYESTFSGR